MALNGLNKITDQILDDAQKEADRILENAQAECDRIRSSYEAKAEEIRQELADRAQKVGTEWVTRAKSSVGTKKRNMLLSVQSELLNSVFDDTLEEMRNLSVEKYTSLLAGLLTAAMLEQIEAEHISRTYYGDDDVMEPEAYEVLMSTRDRDRCGDAVLDAARRKLKGKIPDEKLARMCLCARPVEMGGGLILRCGSIESNCSLDLLFAQLREELEAEVSHALFDVRTSFI